MPSRVPRVSDDDTSEQSWFGHRVRAAPINPNPTPCPTMDSNSENCLDGRLSASGATANCHTIVPSACGFKCPDLRFRV